MALEVINAGGGGANAKVYNVTGSKQSSLPDWVVHKHRKHLKKDAKWSQRVDLIQDFEFPEACNRLRFTPDRNFIVAMGVYKPQMRVFDVRELAMKFERHTSAETVQFCTLSDDWRKVVLLQADRHVEFHTQFGAHFSTRIPRHGRDMRYNERSCELFAAGASNEIYRLNLEQGTFLAPYATHLPEINTLAINSLHDLVAAGGVDGAVEFWDARYRQRASHIDTSRFLPQDATSREVTCVRFLPDGLSVAVGSADGQVMLFDMRAAAPLLVKDHQYGLPIRAIEHHAATNRIVSADTRSVKIWSAVDARQFSFIEPSARINDICLADDAGLVMVAPDDRYIQSYFIPALGPAPKWCSFLENMTEELEQRATPQTFDNFKFVTSKELQLLGLESLVGTSALKPYMHGFFVEFSAYERARTSAEAAAAPLDTAADIRQRGVERRVREKASSRISDVSLGTQPHAKVNRALQAKLQTNAAEKGTGNLLVDSRFKDLFNDPDFAVDESSFDYRLHNPSVNAARRTLAHENSHSSDDDDENDGQLSDSRASGEVSDGDAMPLPRPAAKQRAAQKQRPQSKARTPANGGASASVRMSASASLKESALLKSKRSFGEILKKS